MFRRISNLLARAAILAIAAAPVAHASVTPLPGADGQSTRLGATFANPVGVVVRDDHGIPVAGETVVFNYGGAFGSPRIIGDPTYDAGGFYWWVVSDANGVASIPSPYGARPGQAMVTAIAGPHGRTQLELTVMNSPPPAEVAVVSGAHQELTPGGTSPQPFVVRVRDSEGRPLPGALVHFALDFPTEANASSAALAGVRPAAGSFDGMYIASAAADENGIVVAPPFTAALMRSGDAQGGVYGGAVRARVADTSPRPYPEPATAWLPYQVKELRARKPLQDLWWVGPAESGWGMSIAESEGGNLFIGLFVYDSAGHPTWFVMPGGTWDTCCYGTTYRGVLYRPRGAPFFAYDASQWDLASAAGDIKVTFIGGHTALVEYEIRDSRDDVYGRGRKHLVRQDFTGEAASPLAGLSGMWWGGPAQNGWGVSVMEQFGNLFGVWFTYGADHRPTWFVMPAGTWHDDKTYAGVMYVTRSAPWVGRSYDLDALQLTRAGTFRLQFDTQDKGRMEVSTGDFQAMLPLERQPLE